MQQNLDCRNLEASRNVKGTDSISINMMQKLHSKILLTVTDNTNDTQ